MFFSEAERIVAGAVAAGRRLDTSFCASSIVLDAVSRLADLLPSRYALMGGGVDTEGQRDFTLTIRLGAAGVPARSRR